MRETNVSRMEERLRARADGGKPAVDVRHRHIAEDQIHVHGPDNPADMPGGETPIPAVTEGAVSVPQTATVSSQQPASAPAWVPQP